MLPSKSARKRSSATASRRNSKTMRLEASFFLVSAIPMSGKLIQSCRIVSENLAADALVRHRFAQHVEQLAGVERAIRQHGVVADRGPGMEADMRPVAA